MADVAIFVPEPAVGMSAVLITELCWVAAVDAGRDPTEAVRVVSIDGRPVKTHTGLGISVNASIGDVPAASLIFLSAFWGSSSDALTRHRDVLPWIRRHAADGARVAGCSTGSFFLAATGLLDGRVATTYPPYARTFRRRFPDVEFHAERSITDAGGLMCADAIPSSLDLIIATLGDLYGNDVAKRLATDYLLGLRRNYTVANLAFDGQKYHGDRQVLAVQRWFERHLDEPIRIGQVAHHFGLSPRTLTRRFTSAVGEPPFAIPATSPRRARQGAARRTRDLGRRGRQGSRLHRCHRVQCHLPSVGRCRTIQVPTTPVSEAARTPGA